MSDPDPTSKPDPGLDPAAAALRAAQEAVSELRQDTTPGVAASGGDEAAASALRAAHDAIAAARSINDLPSGAPAEAPLGNAATGADPAAPQSFGLPAFSAAPLAPKPEGIDLLSDVNLNVKIELGRTRMLVEDVLRLGEGSVVELDKLAGDPVDVYVNERHVARGEVLVLNDNFCVRINEIVASVSEGGPGPSVRSGGRRV
ncbi:MAG TPA: flagellar motor switch protein FliN [Phycisphaerales bacterium]|nr:flagellar motor switch protein FliN [Phycisphaerales bacterium]